MMRSIALVIDSRATSQRNQAGRNNALATATRKITMNGQDINTRYRESERLRIAQRITLFAIAGAWSADFFLKPSADMALCLNLLILALFIAALALQVA